MVNTGPSLAIASDRPVVRHLNGSHNVRARGTCVDRRPRALGRLTEMTRKTTTGVALPVQDVYGVFMNDGRNAQMFTASLSQTAASPRPLLHTIFGCCQT